MIQPITLENLKNSVDQAIIYLSEAQQPNGDFLTYTALDEALSDATPYPKTVLHTSHIVHSLFYAPPDPLVDDIQAKAAIYLKSQQENDGSWCYEGRDQTRIAPDLELCSANTGGRGPG
ncbi:MAG: hypothetical protein AAF485_30020 [Chloroflexota bacterium]